MFTCPNRQFAASAGSAENLYMYLFDQVTSFNTVPSSCACQGEVCHGAELAYVFNTAEKLFNQFQPAEEMLSQTMGGYWASFAKSQSPGKAWPLFGPSKTYLKLDENSSPANDPLSTIANCNLWTGNQPSQGSALWDRLLAPAKAAPKKKPVH
jgi:carboxylesterase type B